MNRLKSAAVKTYESGAFEPILGISLHPGGLGLTARMAGVAGLDHNDRVLEVACGEGASVSFLAKQCGCQVAGFDLSFKMISLAKERAVREGVSKQIDFLLADAEKLPFPDAVFDLVMSECVFSLLPDKESASREAKRVLKPGGRLVFTDIILRQEETAASPVDSFVLPCVAGAKPVDSYARILEEIGFRDTYTEDHSKEMKKIALEIVLKFGSLEAFLENLVARYSCSRETKEPSPSAKALKQLFKGRKLGYALVATTKPH